MGRFDQYQLTKHSIGGMPIGITVSEKTLQIAGEDMAVDQWLATVDRVQKALEREGWVEKPNRYADSVPWQGSQHAFLIHNHMEINKINKGFVKKSPWFIRWLWPFVIDRKELPHEYGRI